jgi:hypothetical protein
MGTTVASFGELIAYTVAFTFSGSRTASSTAGASVNGAEAVEGRDGTSQGQDVADDRHQLWDVGRAPDAPRLHRRRRQALHRPLRTSPSSSRSSARTSPAVPPRSLLLAHAARAVMARAAAAPAGSSASAGSASKARGSSAPQAGLDRPVPRHPRHRPGEADLRRADPGASTSSSTAAHPRRRSSSRRSKTTTTSTSCSPSTRSSSTRSRRSPTRSSTRRARRPQARRSSPPPATRPTTRGRSPPASSSSTSRSTRSAVARKPLPRQPQGARRRRTPVRWAPSTSSTRCRS